MKALFAGIALLPAITGSAPSGQDALHLSLCNGGSLVVPLKTAPPAPGAVPCCAKGCRSGNRKRLTRNNALGSAGEH